MLLFTIFSLLAFSCSIMVVASKNPVHSVFFLILVFFYSSCVLLMITADFLSLIFVVVYVGAIAVLFLFVVMMLNVRQMQVEESFLRYAFLVGSIGFVFFVQITGLIRDLFFLNNEVELEDWSTTYTSSSTIIEIGEVVYTNLFVYFVLSGFVLLVAMLGTIMLTLHHSNLVRRQKVYKQVGRNVRRSIIFKK